jgi:hypothetical protein
MYLSEFAGRYFSKFSVRWDILSSWGVQDMKKIVFIFMLRFELVTIQMQKNIVWYLKINISTNNSNIINKSVQFLFVTCSVDGQVAITDTVQNTKDNEKDTYETVTKKCT